MHTIVKQFKKTKKSNIVFKNYVEIDGHKYFVDGRNVVLEPSNKEIKTAMWLSNKMNGKIELLPRVVIPKQINTPDYMFRKEYWDLKTIISNRNDAIYNRNI